MPLPAGVISAKRELRDLLLDWTALVSEGLAVVAHCDPTEPSMLAWLGSGERADYLAAHEAAQDFLEEITEVTKQLESPYLPRAGKKYIGNYKGAALYAREGQRTVELPSGDTIPVIEAKDAAALRLLDYEGTAEHNARIIQSYYEHELKTKSITTAADKDRQNNRTNPLTNTQTVGRNHHSKVEDVPDRLIRKKNSPRS